MKKNFINFICIGAVHVDKIMSLHTKYYLKRTNPVSQKKEIGGVAYNIASKIAILGNKTTLISFNCNNELKKIIKKNNILFKPINKSIEDRSYISLIDRNEKLHLLT